MGTGSRKNQARAAIENALHDGWIAAGGAENEINYLGVGIDPPSEGGMDVWLTVSVMWGDAFWQTMDHRTETVGVLQVDVFTRSGIGLGKMHEAADVIGNVFTGLQVPFGAGLKLRFNVASGPSPAKAENPYWERAIVSCPFVVEEKRTF